MKEEEERTHKKEALIFSHSKNYNQSYFAVSTKITRNKTLKYQSPPTLRTHRKQYKRKSAHLSTSNCTHSKIKKLKMKIKKTLE